MSLSIVLIGAHGVGKSTIGKALSECLHIPFHEELGRTLSEQRRPAGRTAADPQESFDEDLFALEEERDRRFSGPLRIVESWHPGNLAYADRRSPQAAARLRERLRCGPAVVLPIRASLETCRRRQNEPGPLSFFQEVGRAAEKMAADLGLPCLPPLQNDGPLELSVAEALRRLSL